MFGVEMRELQVFLVLGEELSFTRTAQRLRLTPSRISQTIRALERKLGGQLVFRTSRRVTLTALGEGFRQEVAGAFAELDTVLARTHAQARARKQSISIGMFSPLAAGPHLTRLITTFEGRNPESKVIATWLGLEDQFDLLRTGELDLVMSWLPHGQRDIVVGPILNREPRVLAIAPHHPLAEREAVSLEDVANYRIARAPGMPRDFHETWLPVQTPSGRRIPSEPLDQASLGDQGSLNYKISLLVATGQIVHPTVPSIAKLWGHLDLVYIPITDLPPLQGALMWHRSMRDATVRDFIEITRDIVGDRRNTSGPGGLT